MKQFVIRYIYVLITLFATGALAFNAGTRHAAAQPDVFTAVLWLGNSLKVYKVFSGEPAAEDLASARQTLLLGIGGAVEILRSDPQVVEARFGNNSPSIYELVEQAEQYIKSDTDLRGRTTLVVDEEGQVIALLPVEAGKSVDNESVADTVGNPSPSVFAEDGASQP